MAVVQLVKALKDEEDLLSYDTIEAEDRNSNSNSGADRTSILGVNLIADVVAVQGVMASCIAEVNAITGIDVSLLQVRADWREQSGRDRMSLRDVEDAPEAEAAAGSMIRHSIAPLFTRIKVVSFEE